MKQWIKETDIKEYIENFKKKSINLDRILVNIYDKAHNKKYVLNKVSEISEENIYNLIINWDNTEIIFNNDYFCYTIDDIEEIVMFFCNNTDLFENDYSNDLLNEDTIRLDNLDF